MGILKLEDNQGEISIISGEVNGVKGPAVHLLDINLYNVYFKK